MKKFIRLSFLTLSFCLISGIAQADEDRLEAEANRINEESKSGVPANRAENLSNQFGVPVEKVKAMQAGKGWGSTTIELSLAQELMKNDPTNYPTMDAALTRVEGLRAQKMGYGKIAQELGTKLGPVMRAARHERRQMRRDSRENGSPRMDKPEKGVRPEKTSRPQKPIKAERMPGGSKN